MKRAVFFLRLSFIFTFFGVLFLTFYLFYLQARLETPERTRFILLVLSSLGLFVYASYHLFPRYLSLLIASFSLVPCFFAAAGLNQFWPVLTGSTILVIAVVMELFEREKRRVETAVQSKMEDAEARCNELIEEKEILKKKRDSLARKQERFKLLREAIRGLSFTATEEDLAHQFVTRSAALTEKGEAALLYLLRQNKERLELVSRSDRHRECRISRIWMDPFHNWVLRQRQPLLIESIEKEYRFEIPSSESKEAGYPRSLISVPLVSEDKILGILTLYSTQENVFNVEDLRLNSILASYAALCLTNARLYKERERLANLDGLTQLTVRRHFKDLMESELLLCKKAKQPVSLLMLDIDFFKRVNDNHGHLVGDAILVKVAEVLKKFSPQNAVLCRYGGEEFSILLPGYSKEEAAKLSERLRGEVAGTRLTLRRKDISVTLSIGVASFPEDGLLSGSILEKADQALYRAKSEGRNKVCRV